jgi:predicted nuclease of predicted toxin-antitoxin system
MKLLLDQSIPRLAGPLLRELGHDAVHASEIGMRLAPDIDYLIRAAGDGSIVATLDADFHGLLATLSMVSPSTIHLRLHNPDEELATAMIDSICRQYYAELLQGYAITYKPDSVRMRSLPINRKI